MSDRPQPPAQSLPGEALSPAHPSPPLSPAPQALLPARAATPGDVIAPRVVADGPPPDSDEARALAPSVDAEGRARHHIRSFALRGQRLTDAQREAWEQLLPRHALAYQRAPTDLRGAFERAGPLVPLVVEIGCGMGGTTAAIAAADPTRNFIGIEVYTAGIGSLLRQIDELALSNLKLIQHDAVEVLRDMVPPASLDAVHIFFPDPWHKARHHKRRLIQPPLVALLASRLRPGGIVHCATDWLPYAEQMLEVLGAEPLLENTGTDYVPRPAYRPETKFERRGLRLGHPIRDLVFRRRA